MALACIFICSVFFALNRIKDKKIYNPLSIMTLLWIALVVLNMCNFTDLYEVSEETYYILGLGIFSFSIGYLSLIRVKFKIGDREMIPTQESNGNILWIDNRLLFLFAGMAFLSNLLIVNNVIKLYRQGYSFYAIRYVVSSEVFNSEFLSRANVYIVKPMGYVLTLIAAISVIQKRKFSRIYLFLAIFFMAMQVMSSGGRLVLLFLLVAIIFTIGAAKERIKFTFKMKIYAGILVVATLFALYIISMIRNTNIFRSLYNYSVGSLPFFSVKLEKFNYEYTHGYFSWYGILSIPINIIEMFTNQNLSQDVNILIRYLDNREVIGNQMTFNWFATAFFRFYADLGYSGIVLFSFIWGWICKYLYNKMLTIKNMRYTCFYIMTIYGVIISCMTFIYSDVSLVMAMVYLMIITNKTGEKAAIARATRKGLA